jgi:hypothetical protein
MSLAREWGLGLPLRRDAGHFEGGNPVATSIEWQPGCHKEGVLQ